MRSFILFAAIIFFISGCKTADNSVGKGPITLSSYVADYYENKYLKSPGPQYFIVSEDGRHSRYTYCSAGSGQCTSGLLVLDLIEKCEQRSNQNCFVFDEGAHVVWDGVVFYEGRTGPQVKSETSLTSASKIFDEAPPKGANLTSMNNWKMCGWAVQPSANPPQWRTGEEFLPFIKQAHIRGFSPEFCAEFVAAGTVAGLSDATLCKYALGTVGDDPAWVFIGQFSHYYAEAERRGFSPKTCMKIVN